MLAKLRRWPISVRMLVSALVLVLLVLPLAGTLLAWNFREAVNASFNDRLDSLLNVLIAGIEYQPGSEPPLHNPQLGDPRFDRVYSGWYWQIQLGDDRVLTSRSLWDQRLSEARATNRRSREVTGPRGQTLRVLEQRVQLGSFSDPINVAVAADLSEVREEVSRFQALLTVSLATLGGLLLVMFGLQIRWGLAPLRRIERSLREVESGQRSALDTDLPEELAGMARTMNLVLERDQVLIERGRATAGNLAHALKTPLAVLHTQVETLPEAQRSSFQKELHRLNDAVRHHLARASTAGPPAFGPGLEVVDALAPVIQGLTMLAKRRGIRFEYRMGCLSPTRFEQQDLQELVGNLLENALNWAKQSATLDVVQGPDSLTIEVNDDGPGMSDEDCQRALERGGRLDEARSGSGLGLSIVKDLVQLYGGQLSLGRSDLGGLKVIAQFPTRAP
ncbi:ATP-binding protein [Marinobacter shengliensis]|uniref:ATP-binding protein n=1 Tax=Marinobacter shengliensis TaxID=1389223 RepID=UPI00110A0964|nr:HAMP domain-containing sensor histidine kinase [Marinobacter shengliensis]